MKKHQANRDRVPGRSGRSKNKIPQISALGLAVAAAVAMSGAPGLGLSADQIAPQPVQAPNYEAAAYMQPVRVSLLSGVDALAWQTLGITSTGAGINDDAEPGGIMSVFQAYSGPGQGTAAQPNAAGIMVGQNVGVLGALPGNIQLMHPVSSRHITSPYGWRHNPTGAGTQIHVGQDYAIACGLPVYASADGVVVQSAWAGHSGMRVTIDHGSSVRTGYSHNSRLIAKVGDIVKQGQLIALSGTTGNSTGCHVHFEVIINGRWNDPRNFLPPISGQPNPMIDSHRTTIAAEPIRNTGAPGSSAVGAADFPTRWASAPRTYDTHPAPTKHRAPVAAPKADPPATHKPEAKPKPAPQTKTRPETRPAPTTQAPAPQVKPKPAPTTQAPPPQVKPKPAPTTQAPPPQVKPKPAPTTPAPTTPAPTTPAPEPTTEPPSTEGADPNTDAPTTEAPETTTLLPEVNEAPTLEVSLPRTETEQPSTGPTDGAAAPKTDGAAPEMESEPKSSTPKDDGSTSDSSGAESAKQESDKETALVQKAPAVEQQPVKPAKEPKTKTVAAPVKKLDAPAPAKKVTAPVPVKKVAAPKAPVGAAKAAPVAKPKPVAPKVPVAPVAKAAAQAQAPAPAKAEAVKPKAPEPMAKPVAESAADAGGEAAADK